MTQTYRELIIGGVLVAPIVSYAAVALVLFLLLRPVLQIVGFSKFFSNPSIAELSLFCDDLRAAHAAFLGTHHGSFAASEANSCGPRLRAVGKQLSTLAVALVAVLIALVTWQHYVTAPWTRNGAVRVQVANVAPQISGKIVELRVADNQFVHKGDVLYVIDPFDFEVAVRIGNATVDQRAADLEVKQAENARRQHLSNLATTPEEQQIFAGNAVQAKAAYEAAGHQLAQAEVNLKRTSIVSPVNGYVTNLLLRVGDYAVTGVSNISVLNSDSFWIDGYFEETKMAGVCVGDRAEAQLMGYSRPILGHVRTVTRGVSVSNAAAGTRDCPTSIPFIPGCGSRSACQSALPSTRYPRACRSYPA